MATLKFQIYKGWKSYIKLTLKTTFSENLSFWKINWSFPTKIEKSRFANFKSPSVSVLKIIHGN